MLYEEVNPMSREDAELALRGPDPAALVKALLSVTYYDPDRQWVEARCLELLQAPIEMVKHAAITCLGHLARIHGKVDLTIVLPALQAMRNQPSLIGTIDDALDDISMFVKQP
jgi:hypothetical protein